MSQIKYVHVIELENGERNIRPGKGDPDGSFFTIPDDEDGDFERYEWERVAHWRLPEPMAKSEFREWWNDAVESDGENPDPIPSVLEAMSS